MKECFKCREEKELTEFYKHPKMGDGHLGKCKECTKKDVARHRDENIEAIKRYDRDRFQCPKRKEKVKTYQKTMRSKNPEKYAARYAVSNAVRSGILVRPSECPVCGKPGRIEGHHPDYSKPLEVEWMCFKCHRIHGHGQKL